MRIKDYEYTNSQMQSIIAEHIHSDRDRSILKMCYIDGLTHEKIGEIIDLSPRQVSNVISNCSLILVKYLQ